MIQSQSDDGDLKISPPRCTGRVYDELVDLGSGLDDGSTRIDTTENDAISGPSDLNKAGRGIEHSLSMRAQIWEKMEDEIMSLTDKGASRPDAIERGLSSCRIREM